MAVYLKPELWFTFISRCTSHICRAADAARQRQARNRRHHEFADYPLDNRCGWRSGRWPAQFSCLRAETLRPGGERHGGEDRADLGTERPRCLRGVPDEGACRLLRAPEREGWHQRTEDPTRDA